MIPTSARHAAGTRLAALGMVGALTLAGCADTSSGSSSSGGGEGLEPGATMEEYRAAFEGISEITIRTQTPAPKGSPTGLPMEKYFAAVEKWSGGKINFEIRYSNAVADPASSDDALRDGRLDFASVLPIYEPSEYPANNALVEGGVISDQSAVHGVMSSNAWPNQVAFNTEEIIQEFYDHGMVPLLPVYNSGANMLFCAQERNSLQEFEGAVVGSGGSAQSAQVEALGASPTSVPYTELFQSLQRGVVDCTVSSPTVGVLGGFLSQAPHVTVDSEAGFALAPGALAVSKATWENLPLIAKQLLWDKLDTFLDTNIAEKIFVNNAKMARAVKQAGGSVQQFELGARKAVQKKSKEILANMKTTNAIADVEAFVEAMVSASEDWQKKVAELDIEEIPYGKFDVYMANNEPDLSAYTDLVMRDILNKHRPSATDSLPGSEE